MYAQNISPKISLAVGVIAMLILVGFHLTDKYTIHEEKIEAVPMSKNKEVYVEPIPLPTTPIKNAGEKKLFSSQKYMFDVVIPSELAVSQYDEGGESETILFETDDQGFQIFITPYLHSDVVLTEDAIKKMQPLTHVDNPMTIEIDGATAVLFWSTVEHIGKTREVWFAHNDYMYAITTYAKDDAWLSQIMASWSFSQK